MPNTAPLSFEEYQAKVANLKSLDDVSAFVKELVGPTVQAMLEGEMAHHLGYDKYERKGLSDGNSRNGTYPKTVKGTHGEAEIQVPRDRNGSFQPLAVKKFESTGSDIEEKITAMYAKGMTTRDIEAYMKEIYGVEVSSSMVSTITDKVYPLIEEWRARPLASVYPVVYLDGMHFKVRGNGRIINRCSYTALGINSEGMRDIMGIWVGETEGAKFWMTVLNDLKNRGVEDIIICCVDGLTGFPEAIRTVFPQTSVQSCVVHQVRTTLKYVPHKLKDKLAVDLRSIYTAPTEEAGHAALQAVQEKWPQFALSLRSWEEHWGELATFYGYTEPIRRIIYTTNGVENLHRQLRKVTKTTAVFPHEESLIKLLWLAQRDVAKKWNQPIPSWGEIISQFAVLFPDRVKLT